MCPACDPDGELFEGDWVRAFEYPIDGIHMSAASAHASKRVNFIGTPSKMRGQGLNWDSQDLPQNPCKVSLEIDLVKEMSPDSSQSPDQLDEARNKLKTAGCRVTQPRIAILRELIKRGLPTPITELHAALAGSKCDLVTVYRCLAAFEEIGLVRRTFLHSGTTVWEIVKNEEQVYYVMCKRTNRIISIHLSLTHAMNQSAKRVKAELESKGFRDVVPSLQFFAVAPESTTEGNLQ
jgi:Fur family transcriptional regulator, ferric uptake regulator